MKIYVSELEKEYLIGFISGKTDAEIAEELGKDVKTVTRKRQMMVGMIVKATKD